MFLILALAFDIFDLTFDISISSSQRPENRGFYNVVWTVKITYIQKVRIISILGDLGLGLTQSRVFEKVFAGSYLWMQKTKNYSIKARE